MRSASPGRRGTTLVMLLAALAGATCGRRGPSLPPLGPADTVLAFGDSLTHGIGANPDEAYPAVLASLIERQVVESGVPGETTIAGLRRLPGVLDSTRPRLLLLCMGGNDMLQRVDSAATAANLRAMVQLARDRGVAVVLIGVPKPPLFPGNVDYFAAIADEFAVPLENQILSTLLFDSATRSDAVHPNADGYRQMAVAMAALLRAAGAVP